MKTKILLIMLLALSFMAWSQTGVPGNYRDRKHNTWKPVERLQRLDSVVYIIRDGQTGGDIPDYIFKYTYNKAMDDPREVIKYDLPERNRVNRQLYTYDQEGFKTKYLYQELIEARWQDRMLVEYFPDNEGRLGRELFSGPGTGNEWEPYQQHFYSYDDLGRIALYLRKMYNAQAGWYDFSENIWTFNDADQLVGRLEKRVADDYVIWTETFHYGDGIKPTERIRQTMRYDPVLRRNTLTNDTRQLYYYDEFNDPVVTEQYRWSGGEWVYAGKSLYYYSYIPGRKVDICHNGHTISVAPQAVKAHLAHGDILGPCEENDKKYDEQTDDRGINKERSVKVYPNPASDYFELELPEGHRYNVAMLISVDGRVVRSTEVGSGVRFTFDAGGLKSGRYILKIRGESESTEVVVILK